MSETYNINGLQIIIDPVRALWREYNWQHKNQGAYYSIHINTSYTPMCIDLSLR